MTSNEYYKFQLPPDKKISVIMKYKGKRIGKEDLERNAELKKLFPSQEEFDMKYQEARNMQVKPYEWIEIEITEKGIYIHIRSK